MHTKSSSGPSWQFSLRMLFVIVTLFSGLFTILAYLFRAGSIYFPIAFTGALIGTGYGALLQRPESHRWTRSFVFATIIAGVAYLFLNLRSENGTSTSSMGYEWDILMNVFVFAISVIIPAIACASVTELIRMIIKFAIREKSENN